MKFFKSIQLFLIFLAVTCSTLHAGERSPAGVLGLINRGLQQNCYKAIANFVSEPSNIPKIFIESINPGKEVGIGAIHTAFDLHFNGTEQVFLDFGFTNFKRDAKSLAWPKEAKLWRENYDFINSKLKDIEFETAKEMLDAIRKKQVKLFENPKYNKIAVIYMRELIDIYYLHEISKLKLSGKDVFKGPTSIVYSKDGVLRGYTMPKYGGKTLGEMVNKGEINFYQMQEIIKLVHLKLDVLHKNNFVHGDMHFHLNNIMVDIDGQGNLIDVHLIDFNVSLGLERGMRPTRERRLLDQNLYNALNSLDR